MAWGLVGRFFFFFSSSPLSYCGGDAGVAWWGCEWGLHRRASDLSHTSSPTFRTESQYSKLPSADKKKWARATHMKKKKNSKGKKLKK